MRNTPNDPFKSTSIVRRPNALACPPSEFSSSYLTSCPISTSKNYSDPLKLGSYCLSSVSFRFGWDEATAGLVVALKLEAAQVLSISGGSVFDPRNDGHVYCDNTVRDLNELLIVQSSLGSGRRYVMTIATPTEAQLSVHPMPTQV